MFHASIRYNTIFFALVNCTIMLYFMMKSYRIEAAVKKNIDEKCNKCQNFWTRIETPYFVRDPQGKTQTQFTGNKNATQQNQTGRQKPVDMYSNSEYLTPLYVITPTYIRGTQKPDLTRLAQTLMLVPKLHWLLVEDSVNPTIWVEDLLKRSGISYTHLCVKTPIKERRSKVRGCSQRNEALKWIKQQGVKGVVYFADDDNAYDIRLFAEIRTSMKIGLVPTGNLARTGISSPVVKNGKVVGFVDVWKGGRKFPVEMASMGINIEFWLKKGAPFFDFRKMGFLETRILEAMKITLDDFEPKASGCTKVYTWHTNTVKVQNSKSYTSSKALKDTNIPLLTQEVDFS